MPRTRQTMGAPVQGRGLGPWLRLGMLAALLAFAMGVLGPLGLRLPGYREMDRFIADNDLKATAIYYTDLPEFARAERAIRDQLRYVPTAGPGCP
jgi:hypothetical protein